MRRITTPSKARSVLFEKLYEVPLSIEVRQQLRADRKVYYLRIHSQLQVMSIALRCLICTKRPILVEIIGDKL